jgi:DNA repair protein RadA/Sms
LSTAFECRGCGIQKIHKWTGACPGCGRYGWNIREVNADIPGGPAAEPIEGDVISLKDVEEFEITRYETGVPGIDRVFGGGIVPGSLTVITGDPGAGKTTILLQALQALARQRYDVLYVTGEQRLSEVKMRAKDLGKLPTKLQAVRETDIDAIFEKIDDLKPIVAVLDSLQSTVADEDLEIGSTQSIKAIVRAAMHFAKTRNIAIIMVGHIVKGGGIAGPKALEHFVDVSLHLKGDKKSKQKQLCCDSKNRFAGPEGTPVHADFLMTEHGLVEYDPDKVDPDLAPIPLEEPVLKTEKVEKPKPPKKPKGKKPTVRRIAGSFAAKGKPQPSRGWDKPLPKKPPIPKPVRSSKLSPLDIPTGTEIEVEPEPEDILEKVDRSRLLKTAKPRRTVTVP